MIPLLKKMSNRGTRERRHSRFARRGFVEESAGVTDGLTDEETEFLEYLSQALADEFGEDIFDL
jgi:hypothetical protein